MKEDENTDGFLQKVAKSVALDLLGSAHEKAVISDEDRELLQSLLAAMVRHGHPAEKAGWRISSSMRNLIYAVSWGALGLVVSGGLEKSEAFDKATDWIGENINEVFEIMEDAPADMQVIVRELVEQAQSQSTPDDTLPSSTAELTDRRRRSDGDASS